MEFLKENIMKILTLLTTTLLLALTGCGNDKKQEIKETVKEAESFTTVQYYLDHEDLRKVRLKECRHLTNVTDAIAKDCDNAKRAAREATKNKTVDF